MDKQNKVSLPVAIIISVVIVGGFYYSIEKNKIAVIQEERMEIEKKYQECVKDGKKNSPKTAEDRIKAYCFEVYFK